MFAHSQFNNHIFYYPPNVDNMKDIFLGCNYTHKDVITEWYGNGNLKYDTYAQMISDVDIAELKQANKKQDAKIKAQDAKIKEQDDTINTLISEVNKIKNYTNRLQELFIVN